MIKYLSIFAVLAFAKPADAATQHVQKPTFLVFKSSAMLSGANIGGAFTFEVQDQDHVVIKSRSDIELRETLAAYTIVQKVSGSVVGTYPFFGGSGTAATGTDSSGLIVDTPVTILASGVAKADAESYYLQYNDHIDEYVKDVSSHKYYLYSSFSGNTGYLLDQHQVLKASVTWNTSTTCTVTTSSVTP